MSKDGYIQTKVRDLTEQVEELEELINKKQKYLEDLHTKIIFSINEASKQFAPVLKLDKNIDKFKSEIINNNVEEMKKLADVVMNQQKGSFDGLLENHKSIIHNSVYNKLFPYIRNQVEFMKGDRQRMEIKKSLNG